MLVQPPGAIEPFGQRIARLRQTRGLTQERLAALLAVSRTAVSHLEAGMSLASERTVVLLAGVFAVEPHVLVAATDYPVAKADRLPLRACRYGEVDLQLALLANDKAWVEVLDDAATRERVSHKWRSALRTLLDATDDLDDRCRIERAIDDLRWLTTPRPSEPTPTPGDCTSTEASS